MRAHARLATRSTFLLFCLLTFPISADDYVIDGEESLLSVVIHKAGIFSAFAHNHLVHADEYEAELMIDGDDTGTIAFTVDLEARNLVADDPAMKLHWYPRLEAVGILEEPFEDISASNREKIRESMLSEEQLDADRFPTVTARITEVSERTGDDAGATHDVTVEITLHGHTVTETFPAEIQLDGDTLEIEAYAPLRFTDFGIKPYKAMLGAVKNRDEFHVYVAVRAQRAGAN